MLQRFLRWVIALFLDTRSAAPQEPLAQKEDKPAKKEEELYAPRDRFIFKYWDGQKESAGDPIELYRKMMSYGNDLGIDIRVATSPSKDAPVAFEKMIKKIRDLFGIKPLAEGGLTELEAIDLFNEFMFFAESVKKNLRHSRTPLPSTGEDPVPSSAASQPSTSSSDSGSTKSGSTTAAPEPSPLESVLPSV